MSVQHLPTAVTGQMALPFKVEPYVIKHSAAVHISSGITRFQRATWNVLLHNAYRELPTKERHAIRTDDLLSRLGVHTRNLEFVKETLRALVQTSVEWNVLGKDKDARWGVAALLAEAELRDGIITYAYGPTLRGRLHSPKMFARVVLSLQQAFATQYGLPLYELVVDYSWGDGHAETPWIELAKLRELLGSGDSYPTWSAFRQKALDRAVADVNDNSDFRVAYETQKQGRAVAAVKVKGYRFDPEATPEAAAPTLPFDHIQGERS